MQREAEDPASQLLGHQMTSGFNAEAINLYAVGIIKVVDPASRVAERAQLTPQQLALAQHDPDVHYVRHLCGRGSCTSPYHMAVRPSFCQAHPAISAYAHALHALLALGAGIAACARMMLSLDHDLLHGDARLLLSMDQCCA